MPKNTQISHDVQDSSLASIGKLKIEWSREQMPVLRLIYDRFLREKPLKKLIIGACLHVTSETANLMLALHAGGAQIALCASNPLSTQDAVAASLVKDYGLSVFAVKGENNKTYYQHLNRVLDSHPQIVMDDGADLISTLHQERRTQIKEIIGASEETTTGVVRLRALEKSGKLGFPVVAVNDSQTKHLFDNRYGTGQSTIDGIIRATNSLLAGKTFVVCGYGWCSRGIAMRASGMGANVIVSEVNPIKALEAVMDGFRVMKVVQAAKLADIIITATGDKHVVGSRALARIKNGAILGNAGHFNVEIDIDYLENAKKSKRRIRENVEEYVLKDGRKIYLLAEGRLVNLAAAEGHPAEVMDMSFANQALAVEWLLHSKGRLSNKVHVLPLKIDREIAHLKLKALGASIDRLSRVQKRYLSSWHEGT